MRFGLIIISSLSIICLIKCTNKPNYKESKSRFAETSSLNTFDLNNLAADYEHGKSLFKQYCGACHPVPREGINDGLVFDNLFERMPSPSEEYFIKFIQDSKSLKASGDKYSQGLSKAWGSNFEHFFNNALGQKDLNDLIIYIKVATKRKNK